jgi:hypothetical protein
MFSFSSLPINSTSAIQRYISFHELVDMIKKPLEVQIYNHLHHLKLTQSKEECRKYKQNHIPWITPNVMVKKRELKEIEDFRMNFIQSSGYVYFDIDDIAGCVDEYKENLIQKLGNLVSLISKSSTNKGISILARVDVSVSTTEEFEKLYDYLFQYHFHDLKLDRGVRRLSTAWFIPYDNEVFVNHESIINVPKEILKGSHDVLLNPPPTNIHRVNQSEDKVYHKHEYIELSIQEVFETCNLETPVIIEDDFIISPMLINQIRFPKVIKDGSKRKVFRKVIHDFLELNPDSTISHVYLFINHINENYANPKMEPSLLKNVVESQYDFIMSQEDYVNNSKKILRSIHYKYKGSVSRDKKILFSNRFRGIMEGYLTFKRIQYAINFLHDEHYTYTNSQISSVLNISLSTVKRHIKKRRDEYEHEFENLKSDIEREVKSCKNNTNIFDLMRNLEGGFDNFPE